VIDMSGYSEDAIGRRSSENETVNFVFKPFTPDFLARKVRQVLDSKSGARRGSGNIIPLAAVRSQA